MTHDPEDTATLAAEWREEPTGISGRALAALISLAGPTRGKKWLLDRTTVIGRSSEAHVVVDLVDVSRRHAEVRQEADGRYRLVDLRSRNGTFVNGHRVVTHVLQLGDRISIGAEAQLLFTHHDQAQEQLATAQRLEALGRMARGIAHDFNNLLACIVANGELLAQTVRQRPEEADLLEDMLLAASRGRELVEQLQMFSRQSGAEEAVDLGALARDVRKILRRTAAPDVELEVRAEADVVVRGTASQLFQVLMNLGVNACDAVGDQGRVEIVVRRPPEQPGRATLEVIDTGSGMSAEILDRLFEPFFTTKAVGRGTGLGMAVVHGVVTQHGGAVHVDSAPGRGTHITVSLPAAEQALPRRRSSPTGPTTLPVGDRGGAILVVDDDQLVQRSTCRLLSSLGVEVLRASSGAEALSIYDRQPEHISLVIADLLMPGMSGEELIGHLRTRNPSLSIVVLSGTTDIDTVERLRASVSLFLSKPYEAMQLTAAARHLLG